MPALVDGEPVAVEAGRHRGVPVNAQGAPSARRARRRPASSKRSRTTATQLRPPAVVPRVVEAVASSSPAQRAAQREILHVEGAAGEQVGAGHEAGLEAPAQHRHLEATIAVTHQQHRRRVPDLDRSEGRGGERGGHGRKLERRAGRWAGRAVGDHVNPVNVEDPAAEAVPTEPVGHERIVDLGAVLQAVGDEAVPVATQNGRGGRPTTSAGRAGRGRGCR